MDEVSVGYLMLIPSIQTIFLILFVDNLKRILECIKGI